MVAVASLVPRLSPCVNEKSKGKKEPGKFYHVRNVIGREDLITCGQAKPQHAATQSVCNLFPGKVALCCGISKFCNTFVVKF